MIRKLIEEALTAIFGTSNDDYFTSASKIPYFNNVSGQGFLPKGLASVSKFTSVLGGVTTPLSNSDSLDDITIPGKYVYRSTNPSMTGVPSDITTPFFMFVNSYTSGNNVITLQIIVTFSHNDIHIRNYSAAQSKWLVWKKFEGVSIT